MLATFSMSESHIPTHDGGKTSSLCNTLDVTPFPLSDVMSISSDVLEFVTFLENLEM